MWQFRIRLFLLWSVLIVDIVIVDDLSHYPRCEHLWRLVKTLVQHIGSCEVSVRLGPRNATADSVICLAIDGYHSIERGLIRCSTYQYQVTRHGVTLVRRSISNAFRAAAFAAGLSCNAVDRLSDEVSACRRKGSNALSQSSIAICRTIVHTCTLVARS